MKGRKEDTDSSRESVATSEEVEGRQNHSEEFISKVSGTSAKGKLGVGEGAARLSCSIMFVQ